METKRITSKILSDLIQINNDRIRVYENAMEELKNEDADLKVLFTRMISNSHQYKMALAKEVSTITVRHVNTETEGDKVFHMWKNVKGVFTEHNRKTILTNCKLGEDAAQTAYELALNESDIPLNIRSIVSDQRQSLKISYNTIELLCDSQVHTMMIGYI
jgi:uncharacterized protein (TIGR02284 family)